MDWSVGIFPMMTIIAALVVTMLAVRFVYMDRRYSEIIGEYKNVIEHTLNTIETNENEDEKKALLQALEAMHNCSIFVDPVSKKFRPKH